MNPFALIQVTTADGVSHWVHESDIGIVVTGNGYLKVSTPFGNIVKCILPFPAVADCIEEERREWWREV
jgi:hypothetical protein